MMHLSLIRSKSIMHYVRRNEEESDFFIRISNTEHVFTSKVSSDYNIIS